MNAAYLDIRWSPPAPPAEVSVCVKSELSRPAVPGVRRREMNCPRCGSIVYTRRHKLCGLCGELLPPECLFSDRESEHVRATLERDQRRHRAWLRRALAR